MPKNHRVLYLRVDAEVERIGNLPSRPCAYIPVGQAQVKSQLSAVRAGGHGTENLVYIACTPNAQCYEYLRTQTIAHRTKCADGVRWREVVMKMEKH